MWKLHIMERSNKAGVVWAPTEKFDTKSKLVKRMMAIRQPKTPIIRQGHTYTVEKRR